MISSVEGSGSGSSHGSTIGSSKASLRAISRLDSRTSSEQVISTGRPFRFSIIGSSVPVTGSSPVPTIGSSPPVTGSSSVLVIGSSSLKTRTLSESGLNYHGFPKDTSLGYILSSSSCHLSNFDIFSSNIQIVSCRVGVGFNSNLPT